MLFISGLLTHTELRCLPFRRGSGGTPPAIQFRRCIAVLEIPETRKPLQGFGVYGVFYAARHATSLADVPTPPTLLRHHQGVPAAG